MKKKKPEKKMIFLNELLDFTAMDSLRVVVISLLKVDASDKSALHSQWLEEIGALNSIFSLHKTYQYSVECYSLLMYIIKI